MMCANTVQVAAQPGGVVSSTGKNILERKDDDVQSTMKRNKRKGEK